MAVDRIRQMTVEEYIAFDEATEIRYEYIDGEVIALSGGTIYHGLIMANASGALWYRLRGSDCRVISSDMRNRVGTTRYVYPDFCVVCGEPVTDERAVNLRNPTLVGEVTSPSSINRDRGEKRRYYQNIASLQVYMVIDQQQPLVELYERQNDGWRWREFSGPDAILPLPALGCDLPLKEIYDGIQFEA
ncbi:MAG: Uma2 family endonuclease [Chloroflexota bacterium]|nr:Uma2 family endonuclease [Chloroflexota bacterium]MDE2946703.1 Uma2 family endonuclease [Chloroflexota bacterium]